MTVSQIIEKLNAFPDNLEAMLAPMDLPTTPIFEIENNDTLITLNGRDYGNGNISNINLKLILQQYEKRNVTDVRIKISGYRGLLETKNVTLSRFGNYNTTFDTEKIVVTDFDPYYSYPSDCDTCHANKECKNKNYFNDDCLKLLEQINIERWFKGEALESALDIFNKPDAETLYLTNNKTNKLSFMAGKVNKKKDEPILPKKAKRFGQGKLISPVALKSNVIKSLYTKNKSNFINK